MLANVNAVGLASRSGRSSIGASILLTLHTVSEPPAIKKLGVFLLCPRASYSAHFM